MYYLIAVLLSLRFIWLVGAQSIHGRDISNESIKKVKSDVQLLELRSPIIFDDDEIEEEADALIKKSTSLKISETLHHPLGFKKQSGAKGHDQNFQHTPQRQISTGSGRLERSDSVRQSSKSSINDIPLNGRHQVLAWSMVEQSKNQQKAQKQWHESQAAISKTEEVEWSEFKKAVGVGKRYGMTAAEPHEQAVAAEIAKSKQHRQNAATAGKTIGETARLMKVAGSVNRDMQDRMKKTFNPLPVLQDTGIRLKRQDRSRRPSKPERYRAGGGPSLRGQPGKPNGPSVKDMKQSEKQDVLELVMKHQNKKEEHAFTQENKVRKMMEKQQRFEKEASKAWGTAKTQKEYHQAKQQESRLREIRQGALEKQVAWLDEKKEANAVRENIGKINKHLHNRMPERLPKLHERMLENVHHTAMKKAFIENRQESASKEWEDAFQRASKMQERVNSRMNHMLAEVVRKAGGDGKQIGTGPKNAQGKTHKQAGGDQKTAAGQKKQAGKQPQGEQQPKRGKRSKRGR